MRVFFGLLLMAAALAACIFFGAVGAGLAGANPDAFLPIFLMFWGFFGPVFCLGLYLAAGGINLASRYQLVFLGLAIVSIVVAVLAARTLD